MDDQLFEKHRARFEEFELLGCVIKCKLPNFTSYGFAPRLPSGSNFILEFQNGLHADGLSRDQFLKEYEQRVQPIG